MRGHIRQRSKGSWQIIWELPRGADGKRQPRSVTIRGGKKEAESRLTEILHSLGNGSYVDPKKLTVGAYLESWLSHVRAMNRSPSTIGGYESYVRVRLIPGLGNLRLSNLTPYTIQDFYTRMQEGGRKDKYCAGRALSAQTMRHTHVILHTALARAVNLHLLTLNPCDAVEAAQVPDEELQSLTEEQVVALLALVRDKPIHIAVVLAAATGCRRGELCGLKWGDIDLERGLLIVQRAAVNTPEGVVYRQPKTRRSRRAVPLPAFATEALRRHKGHQAQQRLLLGDAYHKGDHVIAREDGRPLLPDYVTKAFAKVARKLELPTTRLHALRHTCASVLLKADVHPRVVSELLGHADIRTTLNVYSHLLPGLAGEAARKMDEAIRKAGHS